MSDMILEVRDLKTYFPVKGSKGKGLVKAVDGVSFSINKGETLGLVGESGCGKSTTGRSILRLVEATSGEVLFKGQDIYGMSRKELLAKRKEIAMIFQDPYSSLNPRKSVFQILSQAYNIHYPRMSKSEKKEKIKELLDLVGINRDYLNRYPHEFSGGQRQRIGIARALALNPELIIADEPVSALDVSIQSQILNLMNKLQREFGLTYIFIAHDLSVVRHISDRIAVMYLGKIVEIADAESIYDTHYHPYTSALISSIPVPEVGAVKDEERIILEGDVPSPLNIPKGCRFNTRCSKCIDICKVKEPELVMRGDGHFVACHVI